MLIFGCALLTLGLSACATEEPKPDDNIVQDDNDYEQSNPEVSESVYSVVGANFSNWNPADSMKENAFKKVNSKLYTFEADVKVGDEFKIVANGSWAEQYGVEDMDWKTSTAGIVSGTQEDYNEGKGNRSNFKMAKAGKLTIELHPYWFIGGDNGNVLTLTIK